LNNFCPTGAEVQRRATMENMDFDTTYENFNFICKNINKFIANIILNAEKDSD
jgi:hypothetical protein